MRMFTCINSSYAFDSCLNFSTLSSKLRLEVLMSHLSGWYSLTRIMKASLTLRFEEQGSILRTSNEVLNLKPKWVFSCLGGGGYMWRRGIRRRWFRRWGLKKRGGVVGRRVIRSKFRKRRWFRRRRWFRNFTFPFTCVIARLRIE